MTISNLLLSYKKYIISFMTYSYSVIDTVHFKIRTIRKIFLFDQENKFKHGYSFSLIYGFFLIDYEKNLIKKVTFFRNKPKLPIFHITRKRYFKSINKKRKKANL